MRNRRIILLAAIAILVTLALLALLPVVKRHIESVNFGNQMSSICFGALLWAEENDKKLPTYLAFMSNEVIAVKILICPGDYERRAAKDWLSLTPESCSYEIVTPGLSLNESNKIFLRCKVHGHLGYPDGTVFDGRRRRAKAMW